MTVNIAASVKREETKSHGTAFCKFLKETTKRAKTRFSESCGNFGRFGSGGLLESLMQPVFLGAVTWKERIFRWRLNRLSSPKRERKGCSLKNANSVGLVYLERDHAHFREIKALAKRLKEEFGVKRVGMMSYVHEEGKDQLAGQKARLRLLLRADLNWYGWPVKEFEAFVDTPFDILIDVDEPVLPLKFVVRPSVAGMKVGVELMESRLDLRIVPEPLEEEEDMEEVDVILQDPMNGAHTQRTIFFGQIDLQ